MHRNCDTLLHRGLSLWIALAPAVIEQNRIYFYAAVNLKPK